MSTLLPAVRLEDVRESAQRAAAAIKGLLGVDVVVIDDERNRIADTIGYEGRDLLVRHSSVVGIVVQTGKSLAVDDKERLEQCRACPDKGICPMRSLIGVPITLMGQVVGAIALVITDQAGTALFRRLPHTMDFLDEVAHSLSRRLQATMDFGRMTREVRGREVLIDAVSEAAALVDERGLVTFSNRAFNARFFSGSRSVNIPLQNVIRDEGLLRHLHEGREADGIVVSCGEQGEARATLRFPGKGNGEGAALVLQFSDCDAKAPGGATARELVLGEVMRRLAAGASKTDAARSLGISRATLYRVLKGERVKAEKAGGRAVSHK